MNGVWASVYVCDHQIQCVGNMLLWVWSIGNMLLWVYTMTACSCREPTGCGHRTYGGGGGDLWPIGLSTYRSLHL